MCWDLADNVTADYAYANQNFSYFCPHACCLKEVRPKHRVNTYFFAPDSHISGCPNEAAKPENPHTTTKPARKPSVVPPPATPTELGPIENSSSKRAKPTNAELLALASALAGRPPRCAGTLLEVVHAWQRMPENERSNIPLRINNEQLTYKTAFYCVSKLMDNPIEQLPGTSRVVYGTVRISKLDDCYWLESLKAYKVSDIKRLHLGIRVPKDSPEASYLTELLSTLPAPPRSFTLFYFGFVPKLSSTGKSYVISSAITDKYKRFVVLPEY